MESLDTIETARRALIALCERGYDSLVNSSRPLTLAEAHEEKRHLERLIGATYSAVTRKWTPLPNPNVKDDPRDYRKAVRCPEYGRGKVQS